MIDDGAVADAGHADANTVADAVTDTDADKQKSRCAN